MGVTELRWITALIRTGTSWLMCKNGGCWFCCQFLLVKLATDLLGDALREAPSSLPRGEPPAEEEAEEEPSSPAEPELELLLLRKEGEEEKQGCELEFSLYMETGLVRVGEPPHGPT